MTLTAALSIFHVFSHCYISGVIAQNFIKPDASLHAPIPPINRVLMGGSYTNPCPTVWKAMSTHVTTIDEQKTRDLMDEVVRGLRFLFQTRNYLTFPITGTGTTAMFIALANLVEPSDKVLVGVNGFWGQRAAETAEKLGAIVTKLEVEAGKSFSLDELAVSVQQIKPDILYLVHGETSTGVLQDMTGVGDLCQKYGCLLVTDVVGTLAEMPIYVDAWKIDAAFANSHKGLGTIVGLAPMTFSQRAWERFERRRTPVAGGTINLDRLRNNWVPRKPEFLFYSPPIQQLHGFREGISLIVKETLKGKWARVGKMERRLTRKLELIGLTAFVTHPENRLLSTMVYNLPYGININDLMDFALSKYQLEVDYRYFGSGGNCSLRIGIMGCNAVPKNIDFVAKVVKQGVKALRKN